MDRKTAQHQPTREERQKILYQWFPDPGGFRYPGWDGRFISDTIHLKSDPKDKWIKKYIELRENKILIFKVRSRLSLYRPFYTSLLERVGEGKAAGRDD